MPYCSEFSCFVQNPLSPIPSLLDVSVEIVAFEIFEFLLSRSIEAFESRALCSRNRAPRFSTVRASKLGSGSNRAIGEESEEGVFEVVESSDGSVNGRGWVN